MSKKLKIAVVGGAGHIGLPFSCFISSKNHEVVIVDNNKSTLDKINNDILPFFEEGLDYYLKVAKKNNLQLSDNLDSIQGCNLIIVTLGTSSVEKEIEKFNSLVESLIKSADRGSMLMLRSTVAINEINNIYSKTLLNEKDIKLAYCPERIAEGKGLVEIEKIPQIIGLDDKDNSGPFVSFFSSLGIKSHVTSFENAAFLKLFSNAYRYSEFTLVNEFSNIANKNNIDFSEIINLASLDYPRLSHIPSTGFVGGPCLIKDTKTFKNEYSNESKVITALQNTNSEFMDLILNYCTKNFEDKKIIQLGLSFKPNSDDIRSSLSLELYKKLNKNGFKVFPVDPNLNDETLEFELYNYEEIQDITNNVLISTFHDEFKKFDLSNKKVFTVGNK